MVFKRNSLIAGKVRRGPVYAWWIEEHWGNQMSQAFDTLRATHKLEDGGFTREQAEAIADIVHDGQGELATKSDLLQLGATNKSDLLQLGATNKADLLQLGTELRGEMKQGFAEQGGEIRLLKWMVGFVIAMQAALLVKLFLS